MEMTCIVCPVGCRLMVEMADGKYVVTGNGCRRGADYAVQEATNPMRTLTSLVKIAGGGEPLCPVKTSAPIPKAMIGAALDAVRAARADAPVKVGDVVIKNIAGTGADLVATANRGRA
jgi:CxxC motif-containing protein